MRPNLQLLTPKSLLSKGEKKTRGFTALDPLSGQIRQPRGWGVQTKPGTSYWGATGVAVAH